MLRESLGIWKEQQIWDFFIKKSLDYKLVGFYDAEYVGDRIERKSTSGNCKFIGENLISWASKRQAIIALSTT